jgi:hypothetical protein
MANLPTIPNTTITANAYVYEITPNEGYVLHNNARDWTDVDPETMEETFYRGYSATSSTVALTYDFGNTTIIDGYTAYGRKEIFARPASEVPENQIFGGGNSNAEIM